jgi:hypothetical protein
MNRTRLNGFSIVAVLSISSAVLAGSGQDKVLRDIVNYREWTKITNKPIAVTNSLAGGG